MNFKTTVRFTKKELEKMIKWLEEWSDYRGGMLNRIDGLHVMDWLRTELSQKIGGKE